MIIKQKHVLITTGIIFFILLISIIVPKFWTPEDINSKVYTEALDTYNSNNFQDAYFKFSRISKSSKLKPAAVYRQALCAEKLGDNKSILKKYNEIIKYYSNSPFGIRARYLKAQFLYNSEDLKKAKKEFLKVFNRHPDSDYAVASEYYLGSIEKEHIPNIKNQKKKQKAIKKTSHYFRDYLMKAPTGRFAINAAEKWSSINPKLTNEDHLIIAKAYLAKKDYKNAQKYLKLTNIETSWPYFVKCSYEQKDKQKVKYYTELGLKIKKTKNIAINEVYDEETENKNIYEAIDDYLKVSNNAKLAISYLLNIAGSEKPAKGYDYLLYKSCNNMPEVAQAACYNTLYLKYPDGNFAAESLANIFYAKIKSEDYFTAKKIGKRHLAKYANTNSAPRIMFWLGKIGERTKNYEEARSYYKSLITKYPDDYYAYHAFLNLNRYNSPVIDTSNLEGKLVLFPYRKNLQNDLIIRLADIGDYALINELCKDDKFIQSWLAYQQGNFAMSATIAQEAMEKLTIKPDKNDLRWRLVYPVHYYNEIQESAHHSGNSPILILSIIREESHFNPNIKSPVGASGLMQLMPSTATEIVGKPVSESVLLNPKVNIQLGNVYFSRLKKAMLNRDTLAVLAYNGGMGSVSKWKESINYTDIDDFVEQIPYSETKNYLKKVYKSYWNYVRIYSED